MTDKIDNRPNSPQLRQPNMLRRAEKKITAFVGLIVLSAYFLSALTSPSPAIASADINPGRMPPPVQPTLTPLQDKLRLDRIRRTLALRCSASDLRACEELTWPDDVLGRINISGSGTSSPSGNGY